MITFYEFLQILNEQTWNYTPPRTRLARYRMGLPDELDLVRFSKHRFLCKKSLEEKSGKKIPIELKKRYIDQRLYHVSPSAFKYIKLRMLADAWFCEDCYPKAIKFIKHEINSNERV